MCSLSPKPALRSLPFIFDGKVWVVGFRDISEGLKTITVITRFEARVVDLDPSTQLCEARVYWDRGALKVLIKPPTGNPLGLNECVFDVDRRSHEFLIAALHHCDNTGRDDVYVVGDVPRNVQTGP